MNSNDNEWMLTRYADCDDEDDVRWAIDINEKTYSINDNTAAVVHAILLLVDTMRDKK